MQCLVSFVIASFELFFISLLANFEISNVLSSSFNLSFNPLAIVPMFILSLVIALFSSTIMSGRINKINAIDALKA